MSKAIWQEKQVIIDEIKAKLENAEAAVVIDYMGITVEEANSMRKQLREAGVDYRVVKNTLLTIAAKEAGAEALVPTFKGVTAIAFGGEDLIAPAQIIAKFSKENKILEIKGGLLEGKFLDQAGVIALGELPPKEVLLAQVASCFQAPIQRLAYVLEEVRKSKETA